MASQTPMQARARSWSWITAASTLLVLLLLFLNGNHVGNNFNTDRYYTILMLVPALVTTLACVILQRFIHHRILIACCSIYEIVVITWYAAIALEFQTWNGDALLYITSYMFIYHGGLYAAMLAGAFPLAYLAFVDHVNHIKQHRATGTMVFPEVLEASAWIGAISIGALLLARYLALGTSHLALAAAVGIGLVLDLVTPRYRFQPPSDTTVDIPSVTSASGSIPSMNATQSASKAKNTFLVLIALVTGLLLSFLWSISYIRVGVYTAFYEVDGRKVLEDNMAGLVIFEIIAVILLATVFSRKRKAPSLVREEQLYGLLFIGFIAVEWLLIIAGVLLLPIRAPSILTPITVVLGTSWLSTTAATRQRESGGLLGTAWLAGGTTTWLGFALSTSPDLGGIVYIISGLVLVAAVLAVLILFIINPYFVSGKQGRSNAPRRRVELPGKETPVMLALHRHGTVMAVAAIVLLAALPAIFTCTAASTSPAQFQLLANVNNDCLFYLADPTTRIAPEYQPYFGMHGFAKPDPNITIRAAKGEYEPVQVVMKPINQDHFTIYSVTASAMVHQSNPSITITASNFTAYVVEPVAPLSNVVQDMLVPFNRYTVSDGNNHPLWFLFHVPSTAMEGDYRGTVTLVTDNKTRDPLDWNFITPWHLVLPITIHVFNFTLPDTPTLKSNFGFSIDDPAFATVTGWFKEHRMMHWSHVDPPLATLNSTTGGVTAINTAALDAEVNAIHAYGTRTIGMHVYKIREGSFLPAGTFVVNGTSFSAITYINSAYWNATATTYMAKLETYLKSKTYIDWFGTNISWFDEVYLSGYDEADTNGGAYLENAITTYKWLKTTVNATLPIMQTMASNAELESLVDIICFHTGGYEPANIAPFKAASPTNDVWIYTTCGPRFPHPTIATYGFGMQSRSLAWQCFLNNYSHYLIWDVATPWNARNGYGYQGWNGGSLLYAVPGGYALSTRMELMREGLEDYEYFTLLARATPSLEQQALLDRVTRLMDGYVPTMDYRAWQLLRQDIGTFLST